MSDKQPTPEQNLQLMIDKVRSESVREGYRDGAYDAIMAFCRSIGVPAIHVSRPSLWATPIDRGRALEEYTDDTGLESLSEIRKLVADHYGDSVQIEIDSLLDGPTPSNQTPVDMPQSPLDLKALQDQEDRDNA